MSSGLSEQRRDMNPPKKRLRTGDGGAETPRGEQQEEGSAVDVVGDELTDSQDNTELKRSTQQREQSIIMPVYNASCWLDECLQAILQQDFTGSMELSVYDDASTDDSRIVVEGWRERLEARGISVVTSSHNSAQPRGVGYAKNMAISQSCGKYLCFQDADDVMLPQRVRLQYEASLLHPNSLIGCRVQRLPEGSTERYTRWINTITQDQLITQVFTSHGPTVVMPTWFCSRDWFLKVGPFDEGGKGVPEDLIFFYQSLRQGGGLSRVNQCLLLYRYHENAATHSVTEETIWKLRVDFLQERVLSQWESFTIWNAGKQGRKLYRCLSLTNQKKVCYLPMSKLSVMWTRTRSGRAFTRMRNPRKYLSQKSQFCTTKMPPPPSSSVLNWT
ncbi:queuosine-tRNA galactosyltransferase isoform X2 [Trachinotus anak]|uniref:queuosine-tRNA galactosyltransferase isoform X2 n=1 Tax=Trachinotus anak TaxID=443729 RepID=UPI0039F20238